MAAAALAHEKLWNERTTIESAEKKYYEYLSKLSLTEKKTEPNDVVATEEPKIEQPKNASAESSQPNEEGKQTDDASPPAADAPKAKKDKKKRNKGKKEGTPPVESVERPATASTVTVVVAPPEPKPEPEPEAPKELKKKSKKSKKAKPQEDAPPPAAGGGGVITDNRYPEVAALTVQQQNAKNQKEKENLAHKLCDNITEELNKVVLGRA